MRNEHSFSFDQRLILFCCPAFSGNGKAAGRPVWLRFQAQGQGPAHVVLHRAGLNAVKGVVKPLRERAYLAVSHGVILSVVVQGADGGDHRGGAAGEETPEAPEAAEPVAIDLSAVGSSDGIVSTLDDEPSEGVSYGVRPFRCMFVRDQKLVSGQRVTLRLLEDLPLDGVVVPANTHLSAICKIGDRLELSVRSLEMNGRIIPLALDAYDTDGLQGIYCPETASSKASKRAADDAVSTAGQTFGGLVGNIASTVIRTGASIAKSATGELSVSVVSGYEFYLVKSEKR